MNIGWVKILGATFFELMWITGLKYAELPWEWAVTCLSIMGSSTLIVGVIGLKLLNEQVER